jgi:hypothetical protein
MVMQLLFALGLTIVQPFPVYREGDAHRQVGPIAEDEVDAGGSVEDVAPGPTGGSWTIRQESRWKATISGVRRRDDHGGAEVGQPSAYLQSYSSALGAPMLITSH